MGAHPPSKSKAHPDASSAFTALLLPSHVQVLASGFGGSFGRSWKGRWVRSFKPTWKPRRGSMMSCFWSYIKWIGWGRKRSIYLAILCDLFGVIKWPFSMVKWPPTRGWKGHFESPGSVFVIVFYKDLYIFLILHIETMLLDPFTGPLICATKNWKYQEKHMFFVRFFDRPHHVFGSVQTSIFESIIQRSEDCTHATPTTWRMGSQHLFRCLIGPWWLLEPPLRTAIHGI